MTLGRRMSHWWNAEMRKSESHCYLTWKELYIKLLLTTTPRFSSCLWTSMSGMENMTDNWVPRCRGSRGVMMRTNFSDVVGDASERWLSIKYSRYPVNRYCLFNKRASPASSNIYKEKLLFFFARLFFYYRIITSNPALCKATKLGGGLQRR